MNSFVRSFLYESSDPRSRDWPLMGSPLPVLTVVTVYLFIVLGKGQQWMKTRNAFDLQKVINIYNVVQMTINLSIFFLVVYFAPKQKDFRLFCIPIPRYDLTDIGLIIVRVSYMFYISRVIDLLDTFFFILRKKNNQVTFLHVYHHASVVLGCYLVLKTQSGGGFTTALALLNSFVHFVMYGYYFMTSYKPEIKASLWWKRYITQVQLFQFVILSSYTSIVLVTECQHSKIFAWYLFVQSVLMLYLFGKFYYKAYIVKKETKSN